jgi:phosphopantothenoylcysteine decarboxylase/phosphopantothenate--cysteine ligase
MRVVLGVSGGIAAYKACSLLRLFTEGGDDVTVVPTAAALEFVGAATWAALSGKPVSASPWQDAHEVRHVRLGRAADLVVVAPATADLLAKAAHGLADDLLTNVLLTARCPVVLAPAMHTEMWQHPATVANVAALRSRGIHVLDPASGRLTGADTGPGRLPEPAEIYAVCRDLLAAGGFPPASEGMPGPLAGRRVVVSAGGTREPLDPVRYLGNRSSGRQGYALARVAAARGAEVTLVSANAELADPAGIEVVRVGTAREMQDAVTARAGGADVLVMAAAVADFRPKHYAATKIKKSHVTDVDGSPDTSVPTIELVRTPDVLAGLVSDRGASRTPVIVGFAAETGDGEHDVLELALDKLARKGCDLLVANDVGSGRGFGAETNTVHILRRPAEPSAPVEVTQTGPLPKDGIAAAVWDAVQALLIQG